MIQNFWVFAVTALMLNLTPGNDMLYVMARSSGQGIKAGIVSSLGIMVGCMVHIMAAVIGISALIAQSATAFAIIKYLGAAYLIYLGIKALLTKRASLQLKQPLAKLSYKKYSGRVC
jgi:threonine/homoserine/homoserine lactone efflux protein